MQKFQEWVSRNFAPVQLAFYLVVLVFLMLSGKQGLLNGLTILCAVIGIIIWIRMPSLTMSLLRESYFLIFFGLMIIPMLLALPDAINGTQSLKTILGFLRYLFVAALIAWLVQSTNIVIKLSRCVFAIMLFWCLDAILQQFLGRNLLGYSYDGQRLTGMFHPRYHLGYVLAVLSPVFFEVLRRDFLSHLVLKRAVIPLFMILTTVIILSNTRAAWMVYVFSFLIWVLWVTLHRHLCWRRYLLFSCVGMIAAVIIIGRVPEVKLRLQQSAQVFSADEKRVDYAASARISLWKTGWQLYQEHPINGIGPGGTLTAYDQRSFDERGRQHAVYHPHLFILEVMIETGSLGLIAYLLFCISLLAYLLRQPNYTEWLMVAWMATMPLNTHVALYGSYASPLIWLSLALGLMVARLEQKRKVKHEY